MVEDECPRYHVSQFSIKILACSVRIKIHSAAHNGTKFFSKSYMECWENGNIVGITLMQ